MTARRILVLAVLSSFVIWTLPALFAQDTPPLPAQIGDRPLRVVVDGSKQPDLIPDRVAVAMLFTAIAIPADADKQTVSRMEVKLSPMRLTAADMRILREELARVNSQLTAHRDSVVAAYEQAKLERSPDVNTPNRAAKETRDSLTWASYTYLLQNLSPSGAQQLASHVARIKGQIKSVGPAAR